MYPGHINQYYSNPYSQGDDMDSTFDERQFGFSPPFAPQMAGPSLPPPPSFVPFQPPQTYAVDAGSFVRCVFRYTYVWLRGFQQFWFFPVFLGRDSVQR